MFANRTRIARCACALGAILCLASCSRAGLPSDFYRTDVDAFDGGAHIDSGSAFGVAVGTDRKTALQIMAKSRKIELFKSLCLLPPGYKAGAESISDDDPALVNCDSKTWDDRYSTEGVSMTGWIDVLSHAGVVTSIEWHASSGYPG
jgi:hypothetical protein